jgi:hypothetical protein
MGVRRGFIKLAVIRAIKHVGGIDRAARVAGVSTSQAGRWNNRNDIDLPTLEHMVELDEAALACGGKAEILATFAAELGHVAIPLPDVAGSQANLALQMAEATAEFGDVARTLMAALADDRIDNREAGALAQEIDDAMQALGRMRALVIEEERALVRSVK